MYECYHSHPMPSLLSEGVPERPNPGIDWDEYDRKVEKMLGEIMREIKPEQRISFRKKIEEGFRFVEENAIRLAEKDGLSQPEMKHYEHFVSSFRFPQIGVDLKDYCIGHFC